MKTQTLKVWDPIVRLCHWLLLGAYLVAYITQEQAYEAHLNAGYLILSLLVLRITWGFVGSRHARFSDFLYPPGVVIHYLKSIFNKQALHYRGHNPAGGIMILLLILCLSIICLSGIALDAAENRSGPLADSQLFRYTGSIVTIHVYSTYISLGLIIMHISGVLLSSYLYKENLVASMVTGKKRIR